MVVRQASCIQMLEKGKGEGKGTRAWELPQACVRPSKGTKVMGLGQSGPQTEGKGHWQIRAGSGLGRGHGRQGRHRLHMSRKKAWLT